MRRTEYNIYITKEDKKRVVFDKHKGKILHFIVQYSALIDSRWRSIMRFDTCHGYAHKHTFGLSGKEYKVNLPGTYEDLLTEAIDFITNNYQKIKNNYIAQ